MAKTTPRTLQWVGDATGYVRVLDQTLLPEGLEYRDCRTPEEIWEAIRSLRVRGAPAIGIAAAMGLVLGLRQAREKDSLGFLSEVHRLVEYLGSSRPTAVNLFWALARMRETAARLPATASASERADRLLQEALAIEAEDRAMCMAIGDAGQHLIEDGTGVLTHCNAGSLATADYGTALALMFRAAERGRRFRVFADETRPLLQGSRLTAWELRERGIDVTVICDNMAAQVMREGKVQLVVVGADRIAANGDTANKIGTYGLAILAQYHRIPFYVAAPSTTFDLSLADGDGIPIEIRDGREITHGFGRPTAPDGVQAYNPAFDVTPSALIRGIVTEKGLIEPVSTATIRAVLRP